MNKTRIMIIVLIVIVLIAILFGVFMAYKTHRTPLYVEDLSKAVEDLTSEVEDEKDRMFKLALYNELFDSKMMIDRHTNEQKKFTDEEMKKIYNNIGGKERVLKYLSEIKDDGQRRNELHLALELNLISKEELDKMC